MTQISQAMTPAQFHAKAYLFLMGKRYRQIRDRWFKACVRGGACGPVSLRVMGITDPANFELE